MYGFSSSKVLGNSSPAPTARSIKQEVVDASRNSLAFEGSVFLLTKAKAKELKTALNGQPPLQPGPAPDPGPEPEPEPGPIPGAQKTTLRLAGTVPPEVWNRRGTKVLPKLRSGDNLSVGIEFSVNVGSQFAQTMVAELLQILDDLGLGHRVGVERSESEGSSDD